MPRDNNHPHGLTWIERLRYIRRDLIETGRDQRVFGYTHTLKVLWLLGSFVFNYRVKCFTCRQRIASWDPIIGAYCGPCLNSLITGSRHGSRVVSRGTPTEIAESR